MFFGVEGRGVCGFEVLLFFVLFFIRGVVIFVCFYCFYFWD